MITIIDSRSGLIDEIRTCERALHSYLALQVKTLLDKNDFLSALPGHLPGDAAGQARLPGLVRKMRAIGELVL